MRTIFKQLILLMITTAIPAVAQTQFPWPVTPFNSSQLITGSFCEYRSTSANGHFHNGTDIPKADGSPVYACKNGNVSTIDGNAGSNSYVRVNDLAYVHIIPNPALSVGDPVIASQTILGTIYPGQGHVHLTNGFSGAEKISILPNSGLTPYDDPWSPIIRYVLFYQNNTSNLLGGNVLSGPVDIVVKVDERNGPNGSSTSVLNNGTYKIGYKIFSEDTATVVFEPPNNGLRFQFDSKPSNSVVNTVFYRPQSSTSSHVYQVTNNVNSDNFWNTANHAPGEYVVMVFTEDTRFNTDTMYVPVTIEEQDVTAPEQPQMRLVSEAENGMRIFWQANAEADLLGYRLYFSFDNQEWNLFRGENVLTDVVNDTIIPQILNRDVFFRLSAVDDAPVPNESDVTDVYGMSNGNFDHKVLIVDGFDRRNGWGQPFHHFVFTTGVMLKDFGISFDSAPNESVLDGTVDLSAYEAVFWISGDEAEVDESFSADEQNLIRNFVNNGGYLFASGSEIAWDLAASDSATAADSLFLTEILKAEFVADDADQTVADGVSGSIFDGISLNFGLSPYQVSAPDVISPVNGASASLTYGTGDVAAIQYSGTGKVVYLAFPFETIAAADDRTEIMTRVAEFFFSITGIDEPDAATAAIREFALLPNYPNPFNPSTTLQFALPQSATVELTIFNALGQPVRKLLNDAKTPGSHTVAWDGRDDSGNLLSSGVFFARFVAKNQQSGAAYQETRKLLLMK